MGLKKKPMCILLQHPLLRRRKMKKKKLNNDHRERHQSRPNQKSKAKRKQYINGGKVRNILNK
jgi:heme exporter protein D